MPGPFDSARRKIARASKHFEDLERELQAFSDLQPYQEVVEPDPANPEYRLHKVKLTRQLEETTVPEIVGDVVSNLRAALDHAVYGIAVAAGSSNIRNAYFPFSSSERNLGQNMNGRCADVPKEIWPLLASFKPYNGGNDLLCALNAVRNADNHALLTSIGTALLRPHTKAKGTGYMKMVIPEHSVWDRTKQEVIFLTTGADAQFEYEIEFEFFVAFYKVPIVEDEPVLRALDRFGSEVSRILCAIEAESCRLGFCQ